MVATKIPLDTGLKLNAHKTFRILPGHLLNVLCMFNLRPVPSGMRYAKIKCRECDC